MSEWKWFGSAGHLCVGHDCRFHLCTLIGEHLISTVGEYWPDREVRMIHASCHDPAWLEANQHLKGDYFDRAYMQRFGFMEIGLDRIYETMVFKVTGEVCKSKECNCGMPTIISNELDFEGYNVAGDATRGHYRMCEKWDLEADAKRGGGDGEEAKQGGRGEGSEASSAT
jgi:hypothetical protein